MKLTEPQALLDILENEIDFLEHCVDNPFGKFQSAPQCKVSIEATLESDN